MNINYGLPTDTATTATTTHASTGLADAAPIVGRNKYDMMTEYGVMGGLMLVMVVVFMRMLYVKDRRMMDMLAAEKRENAELQKEIIAQAKDNMREVLEHRAKSDEVLTSLTQGIAEWRNNLKLAHDRLMRAVEDGNRQVMAHIDHRLNKSNNG